MFTQYRFESFNSKVWMFNIFSNRQAPSRDIASHFSWLQSLMHISQSNSFDGNKRYIALYETICCKAMFFLGVQSAQEILSCDMVRHVLIGVALQQLCKTLFCTYLVATFGRQSTLFMNVPTHVCLLRKLQDELWREREHLGYNQLTFVHNYFYCYSVFCAYFHVCLFEQIADFAPETFMLGSTK